MLTPEERAIEFERAKKREYFREYRAKNREKLNAQQRERYRNNLGGYRDYQRAYGLAKYYSDIEESRRRGRERYAQMKAERMVQNETSET